MKILEARELAPLEPGQLLCRAEWGPISAAQIAFYCAAAGVADPIHYNVELANRFGFDRLVVNGSFRWALMTLTAASVLPESGWITDSTCRHRAPMVVGATVLVEISLAESTADRSRCVLNGRNVVDGTVVDESTITMNLEN